MREREREREREEEEEDDDDDEEEELPHFHFASSCTVVGRYKRMEWIIGCFVYGV